MTDDDAIETLIAALIEELEANDPGAWVAPFTDGLTTIDGHFDLHVIAARLLQQFRGA